MSFLRPDPPSRSLLAVAAVMIVIGVLIFLDALHLIDLHGFGTPMIVSLAAVGLAAQSWIRWRQLRAEDG